MPVQHDSYTIQVDPENPATWDLFGPWVWPMIATPFVAVVFIAAVLLWAKRRSQRRPPA